jgi:hypothetical protein
MCSHIYANRPPEVIGPMVFDRNIGLLRLVPGQANTPIAKSRESLSTRNARLVDSPTRQGGSALTKPNLTRRVATAHVNHYSMRA